MIRLRFDKEVNKISFFNFYIQFLLHNLNNYDIIYLQLAEREREKALSAYRPRARISRRSQISRVDASHSPGFISGC